MSDVARKIKKFIAEQLEIAVEQVRDESKFVDDLGADSLDVVELVIALECEYGFNIPDKDIKKLITVGDAIRYLKERHGWIYVNDAFYFRKRRL